MSSQTLQAQSEPNRSPQTLIVFANDKESRACLRNSGGNYSCSAIDSIKYSTDVVAGNIDSKNDVDLIFASIGGISICLSNDTDGFSCSTETALSGSPRSIDLADIDGENGPDIASAGIGNNEICLNDGNGHFDCQDIQNTTRILSYDVAIGDLDGQNGPDLVFANIFQSNEICLNDGNNLFTCSNISSDYNFSYSVTVGDLDGQNGLDLVFADVSTHGNQICLNDGNGNFTCDSIKLNNSSLHSTDVAISDLDGQNGLDLVFAGGYTNAICLNNGTAEYYCESLSDNNINAWSVAIGIGNVDSVNGPDIVFGTNHFQSSQVCLNNSPEKYTCTSINMDTNVDYGGVQGIVVTEYNPTQPVTESADLYVAIIPSLNQTIPNSSVMLGVHVFNIGNESLTLSDINDNLLGELNNIGTCIVPQTLNPGEFFECSYSRNTNNAVPGSILTISTEVKALTVDNTLISNASSTDVAIISESDPNLIIVNDSGDTENTTCNPSPGICTLRAAIVLSNNLPQSYIIFDPSLYGTTIRLSSDLPEIKGNVIIDGLGVEGTIIDGDGLHRPFTIDENAVVEIQDMTIHNSNADGVLDPDDLRVGGAIHNRGNLTVRNSVLQDNKANDDGGAIFSSGTMLIVGSTIIENSVGFSDLSIGDAGGIRINGGSAVIVNSTIAHNQAETSGYGGGIYVSNAKLELLHVTITGNEATRGGGGVLVRNGILKANNSIISNNISNDNPNIEWDITSNIIGNHSIFVNVAEPFLGVIGNYGGLTPTIELVSGSPAIDFADQIVCNEEGIDQANGVDQRGLPRNYDGDGIPDHPQVGDCDIGAFERSE
ncbi:MAG: hypothetical protein KC615_09055 [Anaerolineae bacterium]|nr:hypothetical protein [Anaerolineae bacterium]